MLSIVERNLTTCGGEEAASSAGINAAIIDVTTPSSMPFIIIPPETRKELTVSTK